MSNPQGGAGNSLGLAVGATNLACTGDGQRAVIRSAAVTVEPGVTLTGFVDRVGDPVPMIAPDGSRHRPETLVTEALDRVARSAAVTPVSEVAVAVPAHWRPFMVDALRDALGSKPGLARAPLVSDATAALTALRSNPGLPSTGVVVLCDFGGSGASITLVDAAAQDVPIGGTVRIPDFSGDQIDQAVLSKVVAGILEASDADPAGTAMVGSLARLRDECRRAKERLSDETATAIAVDVPGLQTTVRMTRMELDDLIDEPLAEFTAVLGDTLERNRVPLASISAVATVGGGARIPLVTQRLSEQLRTRVVTTPQPQLTVAQGVALIAHRGQIVETATAMAPAAPATATVAAAAFEAGGAPTAVGALAWSEVDDDDLMAVAAPLEPDYVANPVDSRPELNFHHDEWDQQTPARRRSPALLFGLAGAAVVVSAVVVGLTAFTHDTSTVPAGSSSTIAPPASAPAPAAADAVAPAQQAQAPVQVPAATTVVSQPQQQVVRQQQAAAAPAAPPAEAPAPEAPAPAPEAPAPAPAPAPEAPAPAPAPENPAPPTPWTPPWDPPWHSPTNGGSGTPPSNPGPGSGTGNGGTGSGAPTGGTGSGTGGTGTGFRIRHRNGDRHEHRQRLWRRLRRLGEYSPASRARPDSATRNLS